MPHPGNINPNDFSYEAIRRGTRIAASVALGWGALLVAGCSPLSQDTMKTLAEAARDRSSCYMIGGGAGAFSVVPGPGVPAGGGYGYFWSGHALPGQTVVITESGCLISGSKAFVP